MIYVLVRDAQDYDDCDVMIFASTSKEKVEAKHDELQKHYRILHRFAELCKHDMDLYAKENPAPLLPAIKDLPPRPLVWNGTNWENAYVSEHNLEISKYNEKLNAFREHLIQQLKIKYDFPKELQSEIDEIWSYLNTYTYSIKEVESD